MTVRPVAQARTTTTAELEKLPVSLRLKIAALWTAMLFVFAYVDIFSLYRPDFRAEIEAGVISGFEVNQLFLLGSTAYIVIPSAMVALTLLLRPQASRIGNLVLSLVYAVTIVIGAIGEMGYYVAGSAIEVVLLAAIAYLSWTWPRVAVE